MRMKIISTTEARKRIGDIVNRVKYRGEVFAIGRRNSIDAVIMKYRSEKEKELDDLAAIAMAGGSFDFLYDEPNIYSRKDLKEVYD